MVVRINSVAHPYVDRASVDTPTELDGDDDRGLSPRLTR